MYCSSNRGKKKGRWDGCDTQNACEIFSFETSREESTSKSWASWVTFESHCIGSSEVQLQPFLISALDRVQWRASRPRHFALSRHWRKKVGVGPRTSPDTSETPCALDPSGSDENQRLNRVITSWLDKGQTASEEGLFSGVRLCYSVRRPDNSELWQDVTQLFKMSFGIMQFIIPSYVAHTF